MTPEIGEREQPFPGGKDYFMYRVAFRVFTVAFLLLICIGLTNFLYLTIRGKI
jgi:hypothetical protein